MHIELNGYVVVAYTVKGTKDEFALTFAADEFSSPDSDGEVDTTSTPAVYRGVWNASEENVLTQLSFVATRGGITEKSWHISAFGDEILQDPRVVEDRITLEFID